MVGNLYRMDELLLFAKCAEQMGLPVHFHLSESETLKKLMGSAELYIKSLTGEPRGNFICK